MTAKATGKIIKINYAHPQGRFTIGRISLTSSDTPEEEQALTLSEIAPYSFERWINTKPLISFKLSGPVNLDDTVELKGSWEVDPKWGLQFSAQSAHFIVPIDENGLIRYLAEHSDFKGLGPAKAAKLVVKFGAETFDDEIRKASAKDIQEVSGLNEEDAKNFLKKWIKRTETNAIATQLASYELTSTQIEKIIDVFHTRALSALRENPYCLIGEVEGFGFSTVDKIALKIGISKDDPRRLRAALAYCLLVDASNGHTWTPRSLLLQDAEKELVLDTLEASSLVKSALLRLIEEKKVSLDDSDRCALTSLYLAEISILDKINDLNDDSTIPFSKELDDLEDDPLEGLNEDQQLAVKRALSSHVLVITGGAGTGKTTICQRIIRAYEEDGRGVALCAPTGKAAKRLQEVTGRECSTLHRLMGFDGRGFIVPVLEQSVIIVDEFSMVDVHLMSALCERLRMGSVLILVGDADQLPPVGPGNVLRDLIARSLCPVARLTQVVRQAGALRRNSLALLRGLMPKQEEENGKKPWIVCDQIQDAEHCQRYIIRLFNEHIMRLGFDLTYDVQLLTAQREGPVGVNELNKVLQVVYQAKKGRDIGLSSPEQKRRFFEGDKVIYIRNNYDLNVFNGDAGVIRFIKYKPGHEEAQEHITGIVVAFGAKGSQDGSLIEIPRANISDLQLAYALTVHKAQGSEYRCVVFVLHKSQAFMHQSQGRNFAYTGATRARETLILVGDQWGLRNSVAHDSKERRRTWLSLAGTAFEPQEAELLLPERPSQAPVDLPAL